MPNPPRLYVPLDINYLRDPKIRRAGADAELLFIRSLAHCKSANLDGIVYDYDLEVVGVGLRGLPSRVTSLVREGLWVEVHGGWRIVSWSKWNKTQVELAEDKAKKRDAAILTNHRRYHADKPDSECPHCEAEGKVVLPFGKRGAK